MIAAAPAAPPRFYVRADFALGLQLNVDQTAADCGATSIIELCGYSARGNVGDSLGGTLGLGYRMTPWLRGDATFAFRQGRRLAGGIDSFDGQPAAGTVALSTRAYTLMFNLYVDLAPAIGMTEGWFQPYVGAGIGPSFNHVAGGVVAGTLPAGFGFAQLGSGTATGFAWNATGGIALRLARSIGVDLGYRYVDLGRFETGSGTAQPSGAAVDQIRLNTRLHELFLGLRIAFN
ncbi:MAG: porin family protein [Alphaproteobacteria bacterium]|nr:porin family protein [Alphaproteobacteria bacterium]